MHFANLHIIQLESVPQTRSCMWKHWRRCIQQVLSHYYLKQNLNLKLSSFWVGMNFSPAEEKYFSFPKGQYNTKLKAALEKSAFLAVILAAFSSRFYVTIPLSYVISGFEHNIQNVWIVIFLKRGIVGTFSIRVKLRFSFYITLLYFFSCKWVSVLWNIFLF